MGDRTNPQCNGSGYYDPTAYEALKAVELEEMRVTNVIKAVKAVLNVAGFDLINRIEIRDRRTGHEYR